MGKVAIIGLGLIGGSLGLALKKANLEDLEIAGFDSTLETGNKAKRRGAVDKAELRLSDALKGANLVILAVPVMAVKQVMETIAPQLPAGCVVTDTSSTKLEVMKWAEEILPPTVYFIGGHPMAGKERPGIDAADPELFVNATYCIIPGKGASPEATESVLGLIQAVGAKPLFIDAQEHDGYAAAVSHLPLVLSTVLTSATTKSPAWREMGQMAAGGYRDVSRLASGDPTMSHDICASNKENILIWLDEFTAELLRFRKAIDKGGEDLRKEFQHAQLAREKWLRRDTEPVDDKAFEELAKNSNVFLNLLGARVRKPGERPAGLRDRFKLK